MRHIIYVKKLKKIKNKQKNYEVVIIGQFLDLDKCDCIIYSNLYLEDMKMVVKTPISGELGSQKKNDIKIENFDLRNKTFLASY